MMMILQLIDIGEAVLDLICFELEKVQTPTNLVRVWLAGEVNDLCQRPANLVSR